MTDWRCTDCNAPTRAYPVCAPCFPVYLRRDAAAWLAAREQRRKRWGWLPGPACAVCYYAPAGCRCPGGYSAPNPPAAPSTTVLLDLPAATWALALAAVRMLGAEGGDS